jgi:transposase
VGDRRTAVAAAGAFAQGRAPADTHRRALTGILFVLKTGIAWEDLPAEMNCGCGMSCWRRLRDRPLDGTWDELHGALLERLDDAGRIDWSRGAIGSSGVRTAFGGATSAPTPRIAGRAAPSTT